MQIRKGQKFEIKPAQNQKITSGNFKIIVNQTYQGGDAIAQTEDHKHLFDYERGMWRDSYGNFWKVIREIKE